MPALSPLEQVQFGGVDSRSNPINLPRNRLLRCLNWCPRQAGFMELRWGYGVVSMTTVTAQPISGLIPYRQWDATKYVLIFQGTTWTTFAVVGGVVSTPTIRGAAISSSSAGNGYFFSNRLHYGNGLDQKFFDGTTWRDSGVRAPTTLSLVTLGNITEVQVGPAAGIPTNTVLILTDAILGTYLLGLQVVASGLTVETFLNGQTLTVSSLFGSGAFHHGILAPFTHSGTTLTSETGVLSLINNLEASAVTVSAGTSDPNGLSPAILSGYQFYMAYYNPVSGHVGNRAAIGARLQNTASTVDVNFTGLPNLSTVGGNNFAGDSEWVIVLGRTGDGAQVPYVCVDTGNNWITVPNTATTFTLTSGLIDGNFELPTRNGIIPPQESMFAVIGDYIYAADPNSPTIRISGSALDSRTGQFMGRPEQSWAGDDIETFPTAESVRCLAEVDLEAFVASVNDCAILTDLAGPRVWRGPWPKGAAGPRAKTKTDHGFFWLSNDRELCTFINGLPVGVSEEYEAAELSQIGDAFLSTVELRYFRDKTRGKDEIRIEGQKSDGTPYTIIHDFKIAEVQSPAGQGYSAQLSGPLGTAFTSAVVRDVNDRIQIFAGGSDGQLYQQYQGADDAGNPFTADAIGLVNCGPERPSVPYFDWYGDANVDIAIGKTLKTDLGTDQFIFEELTPPDNPGNVVQGYEDDFRFRAVLPSPELHHTYLRFQLTSHSADGDLTLNSPPHVPLESYGRIYAFLPVVGDERGV
jgi:hypothetical protein